MSNKKPKQSLILKQKQKIKKLEEDKKILFERQDELQSRAIKAEKEVELKEEIIEVIKDFDKRVISERESFLSSELNRLQDIIRWFIKPSTAEIDAHKICGNCGVSSDNPKIRKHLHKPQW